MGSARAIIATAILLAAAPVEAVAGPEPSPAELRAAKALDDVRGDPLALNEFLKRMPKGGELHLHLHSAVFAETLIQDAIEDKLCVDVAAHAFDKRQVASDSAPS
jgi:adenosine deaminase